MKQVSLESGYGSSSAFTRAFVRQVGMAPTAWLRNIEAAAARELEESRSHAPAAGARTS